MAEGSGSVGLSLIVWIICGVIALCGESLLLVPGFPICKIFFELVVGELHMFNRSSTSIPRVCFEMIDLFAILDTFLATSEYNELEKIK